MFKRIFYTLCIFLLNCLPSSAYTKTYREKFVHLVKKSPLNTLKVQGLVTDQSYVTLQGILPLVKKGRVFTWGQWDNYSAFKTIHTLDQLNVMGLGWRYLVSPSWIAGGYCLVSKNPLLLPYEGKLDVGMECVQLKQKVLVHVDCYFNLEEITSYAINKRGIGLTPLLYETGAKEPIFISRALLRRGEIQAKHHIHPNLMYSLKLHWSQYKNVKANWDLAPGITFLSSWSKYRLNFGIKASVQANYRLTNCNLSTTSTRYKLETKRLTWHWGVAIYLHEQKDTQDPILRYLNHTSSRYFIPAVPRKIKHIKVEDLYSDTDTENDKDSGKGRLRNKQSTIVLKEHIAA